MKGLQDLLLLPRRERESPEVVAEIRQRISEDPKALEFYVTWMSFETSLQWQVSGDSEGCRSVVGKIRQENRTHLQYRLAGLVAVMCLFAAGLGMWTWDLRNATQDIAIVPVAGQYESPLRSSWAGERYKQRAVVRNGERLQLLAGRFLLHLDSGATVSCVAPVDLQILNSWEVRVHSGNACVYVPKRAQGFRVKTAPIDIVDLGTLFGVHTDEVGRVSVHVFEGEVTGQAMDPAPVVIPAGESRSAEVGERLSPSTPASTSIFEEQLISLNGIVKIEGDVRWLTTPPPSVKFNELTGPSETNFFLESRHHTLTTDLTVFEGRPGSYSSASLPGEIVLPAGTTVSSYFVHCNNTLKGRPSKGSIQFQSPIRGIVMESTQLDRTDPIFGHRATVYPDAGSEAKRGTLHSEAGDVFEISEDGRTLTFEIASARTAYDQFRVLIQTHPQ